MVEVFDNFLEKVTQVDYYNKFINTSGWAYTGYSVDPNLRFWYLPLNNQPFFTNFMLDHIQKITNKKFLLNTVYANGQTHGQCGVTHIDSKLPNAYTFLYYLNPEWYPAWGGSTVLVKENKESQSCPFVPNRAILFRSDIPHFGSDPSSLYRGLRITIAFKLELVD